MATQGFSAAAGIKKKAYELAPEFIHFSSFVLCITIYSVIFYNTGTSIANEM